MNENDIREIEQNDFDLVENVKVALIEVWNKKLLIILLTIVGVLFSIIYISLKGNTVLYYSSATLFSAEYGSYSDSTTGVAVMNKYADLIGSTRVCERAAKELAAYNISADELKYMTNNGYITVSGASTKTYGYKLTVIAYMVDGKLAIAVSNAMATAFAAELNDLLGSLTIQVMDEATECEPYNTMNTILYLLAFPAVMFVLSAGIIFVIALFSPWVKSVPQCEKNEDRILGMLPYVKK